MELENKLMTAFGSDAKIPAVEKHIKTCKLATKQMKEADEEAELDLRSLAPSIAKCAAALPVPAIGALGQASVPSLATSCAPGGNHSLFLMISLFFTCWKFIFEFLVSFFHKII